MNIKNLKVTESVEKDHYENKQRVKYYYDRDNRLKNVRFPKKGMDPAKIASRRRRNTVIIFVVDLLILLAVVYTAGDKLTALLYNPTAYIYQEDLRFKITNMYTNNDTNLKTILYLFNTGEIDIALEPDLLNQFLICYLYDDGSITLLDFLSDNTTDSKLIQKDSQSFIEHNLVVEDYNPAAISILFPELNDEYESVISEEDIDRDYILNFLTDNINEYLSERESESEDESGGADSPQLSGLLLNMQENLDHIDIKMIYESM